MAMVRANGVELYYERAGTGEPVVLVHGGLGDATDWALLVPELAREYEVITYDQRGHSRSERPGEELSTDHLVVDLGGLIEELRIAPAHVVGLSMGGTVALGLAGRSPELIRSLAVHEPAVFALLDRNPEGRSYADGVGEIFQHVERVVRFDPVEAVRFFVDRVAPGIWTLVPEEAQRQMADNAAYTFRKTPPAFDVDLEGLSRYPGRALLTRGDTTPKEFGGDAIMPILERTMKNPRLVTLPGSGHVPPITHPAEYGALLRSFFAGSAS